MITPNDKILIYELRIHKKWGGTRIKREFPAKQWTISALNRLIKIIVDATKSADRKKGSGRPRSARTEDNIGIVKELILSQEDNPQTHKTPREITKTTGIPRSSVQRIIKRDIKLNTFKRLSMTLLT